jgi:hypothetical protein
MQLAVVALSQGSHKFKQGIEIRIKDLQINNSKKYIACAKVKSSES